MSEPTPLKPSSSTVASTAIGVPLGIVVVYVLNQFLPSDLPVEVASAVGAIVSVLSGYFFAGGRDDDLAE